MKIKELETIVHELSPPKFKILLTDEEMSQAIDKGDADTIFKTWMGEEPIWKLVAKAQLKKVVEWGNESCPHTHNPNYFKPRRLCDDCWQVLLKEIK